MSRKTHISQSHHWLKSYLTSSSIVLDMTCGNGHDTLFLAMNAHHVYAIDIQSAAIEATKNRTQDLSNITYIHQDHSTIQYRQIGVVSGAVYNLGYLPNGDKTKITTVTTTLKSLDAVLPYITDFLVITCYPGHEGGDVEALAVKEWIYNHKFNPTVFEYPTPRSPISYCISLRDAAEH